MLIQPTILHKVHPPHAQEYMPTFKLAAVSDHGPNSNHHQYHHNPALSNQFDAFFFLEVIEFVFSAYLLLILLVFWKYERSSEELLLVIEEEEGEEWLLRDREGATGIEGEHADEVEDGGEIRSTGSGYGTIGLGSRDRSVESSGYFADGSVGRFAI